MKSKNPYSKVKASSRDEAVWLQAKKEHDAVGKILIALRPVNQNERQRLLAYFRDRISNKGEL